MKNQQLFAAFAAATLAVSCGKTDEQVPTVCTEYPGPYSVLNAEIDADAGTTILLTDRFCDDEGLSQVRWEVHNASGHAHEEEGTDEHEGLVLHSGTEWEALQLTDLEGVSADAEWSVEIPLTARGIWHVQVSLVDAAGNAASDRITELHIANTHIPEFHLESAGGTAPSTWEEEPVWAAGSDVELAGYVIDSDGVAEASISLVDEAADGVAWSADLEVMGADSASFEVTIPMPMEAGEWTVVLEATDGTGVAMETEFHVEVE